MDRRERINDPLIATIAALEGWQAGMWTAMPGIVKSFNPAKMTLEIQPAIKARVRSRDGNPPLPGAVFDRDTWWWVQLPLLLDVPVCFPNGGGWALTFPINEGDEVVVIFMSRCLDGWWQSGGVQNQPDLRMHHLSDAIAIPGPRSVPRLVSTYSEDSVQLRSEDGATFIELAAGDIVNITAPGGINIVGDLTVTGAVDIDGNVETQGTLKNNGVNVGSTHAHGNVQNGGGTSGPPV